MKVKKLNEYIELEQEPVTNINDFKNFSDKQKDITFKLSHAQIVQINTSLHLRLKELEKYLKEYGEDPEYYNFTKNDIRVIKEDIVRIKDVIEQIMNVKF